MEDDKNPKAEHSQSPVIFGEVLFDAFPDGSSVLGGAPFNVAWHLQGFGLTPLFISRVGNDENGRLVEQRMLDWGMNTSGLQHDPEHDTGKVSIELNQGQPSFTILPEQAYDYIEQAQSLALVENSAPLLLYYGSLINRHPVSKASLSALRQLAIPAYVDINLRQPWWDMATVDAAIHQASWLKLNDDEISLVCKLHLAAKELIQKYSLEWVIVTKGADGAFIATKDQVIECEPVKVETIADTVGAGDAFSAVTLYGIINNWSLQTILNHAVEFAAQICMVRGATVNDKQFYQHILETWQRE